MNVRRKNGLAFRCSAPRSSRWAIRDSFIFLASLSSFCYMVLKASFFKFFFLVGCVFVLPLLHSLPEMSLNHSRKSAIHERQVHLLKKTETLVARTVMVARVECKLCSALVCSRNVGDAKVSPVAIVALFLTKPLYPEHNFYFFFFRIPFLLHLSSHWARHGCLFTTPAHQPRLHKTIHLQLKDPPFLPYYLFVFPSFSFLIFCFALWASTFVSPLIKKKNRKKI